jgi:glycosyltransferase involved in cell wall biosynthesis
LPSLDALGASWEALDVTDLRIAWFTPSDGLSGVARYSATVVRALARAPGVSVDVWCPPSNAAVALEGATTHVLESPRDAAREAGGCDLRVYNLGNNPTFHARVFEASQHAPGVVIMHDKVMQDFFFNLLDPGVYYRQMAYLYGHSGASAADRALRDRTLISDPAFLDTFPLFEPCLVRAEGVVTHSRHSAAVFARRYGDLLPITTLQLPRSEYDAEIEAQALADREELGVPSHDFLLVATGHVVPSKRVEDVLRALAMARTEAPLRFVSVGRGEPSYIDRLRSLAAELGIVDRVEFVVDVDDRLWQSYISAADACVNLRRPSTESSSATLVEQMAFGKPVLVYDVGVYAEVDEGAVVRLPKDAESESITAAIEALAADDAARTRIGAAAADFTRRECDPDVFAARFLRFVERMRSDGAALRLADAAADELPDPATLEELESSSRAAAERITPRG